MQQDDEFPGAKFRIDGNALFVEFKDTVPLPDRQAICKALAAKLFDNSEVAITVVPKKTHAQT